MSLSTKNRVYLILIFYFGSKMSTNHTQLNKWTRCVHFLTQSYSIALTLIGNRLYVCAQIPDPEKYPRLHALVTSNMIHECSPKRCLNAQGKCAKGFPKPFQDTTLMDENQYPSYARPQDGFTIEVQHHHAQGNSVAVPLTNQHVVPYNPHLLMLLGCHVNVEFCANLLGSIKYIHKYISKGPDCATIVVSSSGDIDEIHHYQDCCYIGPPEAMWRILQFPIHSSTPTVYRLQLHLQGENQVYFDPDQPLETALQHAANKRSMLDPFYRVSTFDMRYMFLITYTSS